MSKITLLSQETIDKIAAGEVVERPSSVVKELVENAIDAGASAVTVEIKEGGISLIRITDNGCGIKKEEVPMAFLRHTTSKIKDAKDLETVRSLGFRGEALSSIAAVARVELITKNREDLMGCRYLIEGSKELLSEEVGAPDGTTFLIKDLFFNTPARRKFLKTPQTEGSHIQDMMEKLALSHPDISFKFINQNQIRLQTSGNGNEKDLIYHIYGRDITSLLLPIEKSNELFSLKGYIGKPTVSRGNRNYENFFINGRYVKSNVISGAIEEAYKGYLMQHQYPFTVLYFDFTDHSLDVNVHPTKMELRMNNQNLVYEKIYEAVKEALSQKELIPQVPVGTTVNNFKEKDISEKNVSMVELLKGDTVSKDNAAFPKRAFVPEIFERNRIEKEQQKSLEKATYVQEDFATYSKEVFGADEVFLTKDAKKKHKVIGQLFKTYWLIEFEDNLYIVDQHAAHEKVLFERTMATLKDKEFTSQTLNPPLIISLDAKEQETLSNCKEEMERLGYVVEPFGGREYMISAVPDNLFSVDGKDLFVEMLDELSELSINRTSDLILEKVALMSCKAAVKGHDKLSLAEMDALMEELLECENPFHCPHGRPTIISMSKYELEKKFKRIV